MFANLVLVLNCGSSSLKFAVLDPKSEKKYLFGLIDRLNLPYSRATWYSKNHKNNLVIGNNISHEESLNFVVNNILNKEHDLLACIKSIGHRIVHGGMNLKTSVIITEDVIQEIKNNIIFAPLHNPINLLGVQAALKYFPNLCNKNVAVLDTAFYHTLPESAYLYAIPYHFYQDYGIRRYGAHGISHYYVAREAAKMLDIKFTDLNIITCHLGSGASVTAICNGLCVDTSMGLTPLEGLVMGTRSGDIDPSIIFFMKNIIGINLDDIQEILLHKSGILGLSNGITSDFRYLEKNYYYEHESKRSVDIFCHRLSKYISAYTTLLNGRLDAIVFTGGIGENSTLVRAITVLNLSLLGIKIDTKKNEYIKLGKSGFINIKNTIPVLVIPTNEELIIAQETIKLFN